MSAETRTNRMHDQLIFVTLPLVASAAILNLRVRMFLLN